MDRDTIIAGERGYLQPHELASIARWKWYGAATRVQSGNSPEIVERFTRAPRHLDPRVPLRRTCAWPRRLSLCCFPTSTP